MTNEVYTLIQACVQGKKGEDFVFTREGGKPIRDFRTTWRKVCKRAGIQNPNLLVHDLRRTGARNLRRLGLAENTIMKIGDWKTADVFKRYDITAEDDLIEAARRLDAKNQNSDWAKFGHNLTSDAEGSKLSN